jgi:hypothetical protein
MKSNHPPGSPMTLGNVRHLGVHRLVATCLNDACRHQGLIDVSKYPDDTDVPSFASKVVCAKCGARGRHIDVRPKPYRNRVTAAVSNALFQPSCSTATAT